MVYITGDCHAGRTKFSTENFPEQKDMTRNDFVIVCGDFGHYHDNQQILDKFIILYEQIVRVV